jgi:hypothetical protein
MKEKYIEASELAKEQYLELEKQKEKYDQLQVIFKCKALVKIYLWINM